MKWILLLSSIIFLTACGGFADLPISAGTGPNPVLPRPEESLIPIVNIAPAVGWPSGAKPTAAPELQVVAFADDLQHPRWLYVLPNGDVLVAETAEPETPVSFKEWVASIIKSNAGAAVPSADRITLLRDTDNDGVADLRTVFLDDLHSPFGMVLIGNNFYVANTDAVMRFPYSPGQLHITTPGTKIVELPAGPINYHWTKSLTANKQGPRLYVGVGSNSNIAENGIDKENGRAAIWEVNLETGEHKIYASGLRNPVGMDWAPATGELWVAVNERDMLGSDLVPDYMTSIEEGGFYGWPYSYFGQHIDERVQPQRPELVASAIVPDYALGPHTASLGLAWSDDNALPERFQHGMFVGQHGSWNRVPRSGYKVIFVPFKNGEPSGQPIDVLTGFVNEQGEAMGRPVGVVIDKQGGLLVADDVGNVIWRVSAASDAPVGLRH